MYCNKCGKEIKNKSKYCVFCGAVPHTVSELIDTREPAQIITKDISSQGIISCPICKNSDKIAKVSAVYSSGVSESRYSGTATSLITPFSSKESSSIAFTPVSMSGYNVTELSKTLAPPPIPKKKSSGCLFAFLIVLLMFSGGLGIGFLIYNVVNLAQGNTSAVAALDWLYPIVGFIIYIFVITFMKKRNTANRLAYESALEDYNKEKSYWDKLYYCFRDDFVFDPKTDPSSPGTMSQF